MDNKRVFRKEGGLQKVEEREPAPVIATSYQNCGQFPGKVSRETTVRECRAVQLSLFLLYISGRFPAEVIVTETVTGNDAYRHFLSCIVASSSPPFS